MQQIIITTNFSEASRNALSYACSLLQGREDAYSFLLLHIYTIPVIYTGDMVGMAGVTTGLEDIQEQLEDELSWLKQCNPKLQIKGRIMLGGFMESIQDQIREEKPALLVMGISGDYEELWSWDSIVLSALRDLPVPVLTVPKQVTYRPLRRIAYACNFHNVSPHTPVEGVREVVRLTGAQLHVVHVQSPATHGAGEEGAHLLESAFGGLDVAYHTLQDKQVVDAIAHYLEDEQMDLLLVVPKRHGIWADLFHKSNTKALARLNRVPVLALREE